MYVNIRDLKARLSAYLRLAEQGQKITITKRGRPVACLVPPIQSTSDTSTLEARIRKLVAAGVVIWSGRKLRPFSPVAQSRGQTTVSELLLENRE